MLNVAEKYHQTYLFVFHDTLRFYKRQAGLTSQVLADRIGVEKTTVDKWLRGESAAQGGNLIGLFQVFGAGFINDLLRPFGFGGACEVDGGDCNPFIVNATAADALSVLSRALHDGRIDHIETPDVQKQLRALINDATALLTSLDNQPCNRRKA